MIKMKKQMVKRIMKCSKCGGTKFSFRWEYDKDDRLNLYLCPGGWGFQLEKSIIKCEKCKKESSYEEEDFLTTSVRKLK